MDSFTVFIVFLAVCGVLGLGFFVFIAVVLASRGRARPSGSTAGAVTLTIAMMMLLSGLWCAALSPTVTERRYDTLVSSNPTIQPGLNWTSQAKVLKDERVEGTISVKDWVPTYENGTVIAVESIFDVYVYDPLGEVVWAERAVPYSHFTLMVSASGTYTFCVANLGLTAVATFIGISKSWPVVVRPLEPFGQWLSLVSLPIIGLGVWAVVFTPRRAETG